MYRVKTCVIVRHRAHHAHQPISDLIGNQPDWLLKTQCPMLIAQCPNLVACPRQLQRISARGARLARRDDRGYREYLTEEQCGQTGCPARKPLYN
jgi:hypothetical protein